MRDVMQDLETLGTTSGSVILSIGAVAFDGQGLGEEFYAVVSIASSLQHGLTVDQGTLDWWSKRTPAAQRVIFEALGPSALALTDALDRLSAFLRRHADTAELRLWGNGSDFDNVLLAAAYRAAGRTLPWQFWNARCFRTLKNLFPGHAPRREGEHHNALDDAKHQARHAVEIVRARGAL